MSGSVSTETTVTPPAWVGLIKKLTPLAGIFAFLLAWSDFLIAVVFLRSSGNYTLPIGLQTFFSENNTEWGYVMAVSVVVLVPPVIVFGFLHRHFSVGGIGGSLAGH